MNQNPEHLKDAVSEAITTQEEPPNTTLWTLFRQNYSEMNTQVSELNEQLNSQRGEVRKLAEALMDAGLMDADGNIITRARPGGPRGGNRFANKQTFSPQQTGTGSAAPGSPGAGGVVRSSPGLRGKAGTELELTAVGGGVVIGTAEDSRERTLASMSSFRRLVSRGKEAGAGSASARALEASEGPHGHSDAAAAAGESAASSVPGSRSRKHSVIAEEGEGGSEESAMEDADEEESAAPAARSEAGGEAAVLAAPPAPASRGSFTSLLSVATRRR
jgi:hypothetical protein